MSITRLGLVSTALAYRLAKQIQLDAEFGDGTPNSTSPGLTHGGDPLTIQINQLSLAAEPRTSPQKTKKPLQRRDRSVSVRGVIRPRQNWFLPIKSAFDFVIAALLSLVALPLIACIALLVKLSSRGPAFYTQQRVGRMGRLFTIYKIRTMVDKCESLTGARWSMPGDPRITRLGWFLRTTHLDELPQLLNVLRGEMSLIGPRPERPEFVPELERELPAYRQRLSVRPGVTGLAQVQQPADTDLDSVRRKLNYDLFYIRNVSPWLDFRLLIGTGFYALGLPFGVVGRLLGIPTAFQAQEQVRAVLGDAALPARLRKSA